MRINKSLLLLLLLYPFLKVKAQSCLGRPNVLVNVTFGSGPNPGPPIKNVPATYTYTDLECPDDNYYTIRNSVPGCYSNSWHALNADHTGDPNGYFMIVDGSFNPGTFFIDTAKGLCSNNAYEFTLWLMNIDGPGQNCRDRVATYPDITLKVEKTDGTAVGSYHVGTIAISNTPIWKKYSVYFTAPAGLSDVVLKILDNVPGGCGNDFVLDDISVRHCETQELTFYNERLIDTIKELREGKAANLTFAASLSSGNNSQPFRWQESKDRGKTWTDIAGANAATWVKNFPASTPLGYYSYRSVGTENSITGSIQCRITSNVLTVHVIKQLFIPNAFSPNGDGINDTWIIQAERAQSGYDLSVFDRSGTMVFRTNNYFKHWDGTYNGRPLPVGTYYYLIDFKDGLAKEKGSVTLLK